MTIDALDRRLSKVITHYTARIDEQYTGGDKPLTHADAVEIAKETSDLLAIFKQEMLRHMQQKEAEWEAEVKKKK
ncbi:MAG: hypothetical protein IJT01_04585 [Selenomonadaceae bacterium]|nr:hypothetical protein [Selenomonadaceae bacterium]